MNAPLSQPTAPPFADCLLHGGWTIEEVVDDRITVDDLCIRRCGITAVSPSGAPIVGSAAGLDDSVTVRAWSELLERASILSHGGPSQPPSSDRVVSRSNGVALSRSWADACHRARLELAERDRVLRSWQGEMRPRPLDVPSSKLPSLQGYTWRVARLPGDRLWSADVEVVVALAFGSDLTRPLLRGFGAASDVPTALRHAVGECIQALAFLTADDVPTEEPAPAPTPLYHLDRYLWPPGHAILHAWLNGELPARTSASASSEGTVTYTELTPPWGRGRFRVARATSDAANPLVFGAPPDPGAFPHPIP